MTNKRQEKNLRKADEKAIEASKTMVTLESQFLDALRLKSLNAARESSHTITNLIKRSEFQMKKEINRKCDPGLSRYRRQVYLTRRNELVDCYRGFNENLLMMQTEFETRVMRYYTDRYWSFHTTTTFLQSLEASLTTQKEKLKHRILGMLLTPPPQTHISFFILAMPFYASFTCPLSFPWSHIGDLKQLHFLSLSLTLTLIHPYCHTSSQALLVNLSINWVTTKCWRKNRPWGRCPRRWTPL